MQSGSTLSAQCGSELVVTGAGLAVLAAAGVAVVVAVVAGGDKTIESNAMSSVVIMSGGLR
jgi:hypothetical protein